MLVFFQLKTLDLDQAARVFADQAASHTGIFASTYTLFGWSLATIMGVGLFCGAMGKSAQFPLHVWLPDAMAGPTPVSALIHAATMVAAGVYLVARVFRLMTPDALMFISTIGCITLFLMALIAIVQTDIKKCLAYSTLSQLGYMIFGMGCGAWIAALFHLITHAFFKAMLFLGSGQVIEGCHHEQDMRKMGGLRKKMPVTCITFLIGVLAIAGTGIPGSQIGLGGFFSKDEILAVAWMRAFDWDDPHRHEAHDEHHAGHQSPLREQREHGNEDTAKYAEFPREMSDVSIAYEATGDSSFARAKGSDETAPRVLLVSDPVSHSHNRQSTIDNRQSSFAAIFHGQPKLPKWMFWLAIITAYVTPFYMMRAWWMTFMGKPRDHHVYDHAHESWLMYVPLAVLAVGTVFSSYRLFRPLISDAATTATAAPLVLASDGHVHSAAMGAAHHWLMWGVGLAFAVGFLIAMVIYGRGLELAEMIRRLLWPIHRLLEQKYYIDHLYDLVWVRGCVLVAKIARFVDTYIVDLIFDTLAAGTERLAAFSGLVVDAHGVDGVVNGVAKSSMDFAGVVRSPQTGRIRNYVMWTAGVATAVIAAVVIRMVWFGPAADKVVKTAASVIVP
jgi:NADH:ubiquinone oxidoreductase subunit 5 (subunit L)/multisubunit Na+/H+ antiporter MnhA subunit